MKTLVTTFALLLTITAAQADAVFGSDIAVKNLPIGNMLKWSTLSENGSDRFVIERSHDGETFEQTGDVKAVGTSTDVQQYDFLDVQATGINSYRIKYIAQDGSTSYSNIITTNNSNTNHLTILSVSDLERNDQLQVQLEAREAGNLSCTITTMRGEIVAMSGQPVTPGAVAVSLDFGKLEQGNYKVIISMGDEQETLTVRYTGDDALANDVASNKE